MWSCAVCNEYTLGRLCNDCVVLRHSMTLYGKAHVINTVNKIFKRNQQGIHRLESRVLTDAAKDAQAKAEEIVDGR